MTDRVVYSGVVMVPQKVRVTAKNRKDARLSVEDAFAKKTITIVEKDGEQTVYPAKLLELRDTGLREKHEEPEPWTPPEIA